MLDRMLAESLVEAIQKCRREIDKVELLSRGIDEEALRTEMKQVLGRASLDLYSKAMGMVLRKYPELDPYKKEGD